MRKRTLRNAAIAAMNMTLVIGGVALAQAVPATPTPGTAPAQAATAQPAGGELGKAIQRQPGDAPGPIDSVQDLQDTLKMAFMAADQNHDGQISQQEAIDAGNMLVGGIFFSADADGDGKVTQQERQAASQKLMQQNPLLRFVIQRSKHSKVGDQAGGDPGAAVVSLLDTDNDKAFSAAEVRQAVQTVVQASFATADTDHNGQLSPTELNSAVYGAARAGVQAAFQKADKDSNNALSKQEFTQALADPANTAFDILDANLDGQLTQQELDQAARLLVNQIRAFSVPRAQNSVTKLIQDGRTPEQVAPVPNVQVPAAATNRNPGQ